MSAHKLLTMCPPTDEFVVPLAPMSGKRPCRDCGREVYVAPEMLAGVALVGAVCTTCALAMADTEADRERVLIIIQRWERHPAWIPPNYRSKRDGSD